MRNPRADLIDAMRRRTELVERLEGDACRRSLLTDQMDISRPTIYRGLENLQGHELVAQREGMYETTAFGAMAHRAYREFLATIDALCRFQQAVDSFPDADVFDPGILPEAAVNTAQRDGPLAPLQAFESMLTDASRVRIMLPVDSPRLFALIDSGLDGGLQVDVLLDTTYERSDPDTLLVREDCSGIRRSGLPPILVALVDAPVREMGMMTFDGVGRPEVLVRNTTDTAMGWAEAVYQAGKEPPPNPPSDTAQAAGDSEGAVSTD